MKSSLFRTNISAFLLLAIVSITTTGCNWRKKIGSGKSLVTKIKVKGAPLALESEIASLSQTKPNSKTIFLFRYNMWLYIWNNNPDYNGRSKAIIRKENQTADLKSRFNATPESDTRTYNYLNKRYTKSKRRLDKAKERRAENSRTVWEKPAILDTAKIISSIDNMKRLLFNRGYFVAQMSYETTLKRRKAKIIYKVVPYNQYYIKTISFKIPDKRILNLVNSMSLKSRFHTKKPYDGNVMSEFRDSITNVLRDNGYFNFNKDYIYFEVDSTLNGDSVKVSLGINNPGISNHKINVISKTYIEPGFRIGKEYERTLTKDTIIEGMVFMVNNDVSKIRPIILANNIFLRPGQMYRYFLYQNTLNRLANLQQFRYIDVTFNVDSTLNNQGDTEHLVCRIKLSSMTKQEVGADLELNSKDNSQDQLVYAGDRSLGLATNLTYKNRNIAHNALQFDSRIRLAAEVPIRIFRDSGDARITPNYLIGFTNSLTIPKVLLFRSFFTQNAFRHPDKKPVITLINLNFIYENNNDFIRTTVNTNLTYQVSNKNKRFFIVPVDVSLNNTEYKNEAFRQQILNYGDLLLINLFQPNLIIGSRIQYLINEQPLTLVRQNTYFTKFLFEIGGNSLRLFDNIVESSKNSTEVEPSIFNIQYFQYLKAEADARYYFATSATTNLAIRGLVGFGLPYGKSSILPFQKRFFIGGANSVRAYRLRKLGPGSYSPGNSINFDQSGDMKIEFSTEFRFPIISLLKGAFFIDGGNIWTYRNDNKRPGSNFEFNRFYKEFALGTGFGARFDLSIFVFRLDLGINLRNPSNPEGKRFVWNEEGYKFFRESNLQIGVGYPF
ncbi:MAG: BamA/TamA family outer membrane protein [Bacteroidota bacterium]|nr:BamA/TamA family outer membrane protein [Bacteroidota bacterium]